MANDPSRLDVLTRLWFAWVCFFRVLFDGAFAARAYAARLPAGPKAPEALPKPALVERPTSPGGEGEDEDVVDPRGSTREAPPRAADRKESTKMAAAPAGPPEPALQLLALLQREGRLIDFLQEDVTTFPDQDVGAAARLVHQGCRKALLGAATFVPVRPEAEGATVVVESSEVGETKLVGNVHGSAPFRGVLRHRGWRVEGLHLPAAPPGQNIDLRVIAPAEVEL